MNISSLQKKVLVPLFCCSRDLTTNCGEDDPVPPTRVNTTERLADLRAEMGAEQFDAYIVPLDGEGRREWISGFTGSNGDAIVTEEQVWRHYKKTHN